MKIRILLSFIALLFFTNIKAQSSAQRFLKDSLDNYIRQGLSDWNIPGLAIGIVKDGQVAWMKGYGVKDIATNEPVDENTLFLIASNTKLFTGTALAQLEYNNKLQLNDRVVKYLPEFALYDSTFTKLVNIRDLLSHRIGTKTYQGDFSFWNSNLSRKTIIRKMRMLKPPGIFRQSYGYCNSCYVAADEIIPAVSRQPWEVYVFDSILMPLQMNNTHTLAAGIDQRENVAKPYTSHGSQTLHELPYERFDNMGPATSMVSNIHDMSKWLQFQLDSGRVKDKQVIPWAVLQKTRELQSIVTSSKSANYPTHFRGYGLGINAIDYNGYQVYYHTGGAFGFVSNTCFVPEINLGIVILTNNDDQRFFEALRLQLLDAFLGVPYTNRSKNALVSHLQNKKKEIAAIELMQARTKASTSPMLIDAYTGTYTNDIYGRLIITKKSAKALQLEFKSHNNLKATLQYMDSGEWMLSYNHKGYGIFATRFTTDKGRPATLEIKVPEFLELDSYSFVKQAL